MKINLLTEDMSMMTKCCSMMNIEVEFGDEDNRDKFHCTCCDKTVWVDDSTNFKENWNKSFS
jgi:hypothetical protein